MHRRDVLISISQHPSSPRRDKNRTGMLAPMVVCALVVVLLMLALVMDQLWLQNASIELEGAAESAALAAGRKLVSDDLLRLHFAPGNAALHQQRLRAARLAAAEMAARHRVAGAPLQLQTDSPEVLRFGRLQRSPHSGAGTFIETTRFPDCVELTARRNRRNRNPVALFLRGLTGQYTGNVSCRVRVFLAHHIVGVRPRHGVPVPMWPLGLPESASLGMTPGTATAATGGGAVTASPSPPVTWESQIDRRSGGDRFTYDEQSRQVMRGPDGIPEMVLTCTGRSFSAGPATGSNPQGNSAAGQGTGSVCLLEMGSGWQDGRLDRQFTHGITVGDAKNFFALRGTTSASSRGFSFRLDTGPLQMSAFYDVPQSCLVLLEKQIGHCRMVWLYRPRKLPDESGFGRVECVRLVAVRLLSVRQLPDGRFELVFQPGALVSSTALLADRNLPPQQRRSFANPYIYKLQLIE